MRTIYSNKVKFMLVMFFGLLSLKASAQNDAFVQVIHNAADPAAAVVDIYVNGTNTLDDFEFRQATEFLALPSGVEIEIGVAPGNSASADDIIATFTYTLEANQSYILVANGLLGDEFSSNPNDISTAFDIKVIADVNREVETTSNVEFLVFHGATDAPSVDVRARGVESLLVENAPYFANTGYLSVPAAAYELDVLVSGTETIAYAVNADLSGLADNVVTVLASGFLNSKNNSLGAQFGLIAVLADGTVVELPSKTAQIQVVHNAADPAAGIVDIFLNGSLGVDDFEFRTATGFLEIPAYLPFIVDVAGPDVADVTESIATFETTFEEDTRYTIFANGVLQDGFSANPNDEDIAFNLFAVENPAESASDANTVSFKVFHGATDAPGVDVFARGVEAALVSGATYGAASDYIEVPAAAYELDINVAGTETVAAAFDADLSGLGGGVAIVAASGFYDVSENNYGALFGLIAVLADGTVVELPSKTAKAQVIHNAADPAATVVDIYVNGALALDDFEFRQATAFLEFPAYLPIEIGVATPNSESIDDAIALFGYGLEENVNYALISNGVLNPEEFTANPDDETIGFDLFVMSEVREEALEATEVDLVIFHGATDAPSVDVAVDGTEIFLVENMPYGFASDYVSVDADAYRLNVNVAGTTTTAASFDIDLSNLGGSSAIVLASGFLTPETNNDGEAFALVAVLADGTTVTFNAIGTSVADNLAEEGLPGSFTLRGNYPNPFNPSTNIQFDLPVRADVTLNVFNVLGQQVMTMTRNGMTAGSNVSLQVDASSLASGVYLYQIQAIGAGERFTATGRMTLIK